MDLFVEERELSDDQELNITDTDQSLSEEQTHRDTMRGIGSYMGWTLTPDIDSGAATSDDNPFAGPKLQTPGKVSVNLPTDGWLCRKMNKLNLTLVQGYPSRTSEAGGLLRDQFIKPVRSQSKWYGLHTDKKQDPTDSLSSRLFSPALHVSTARTSELPDKLALLLNPPLSGPISQESLRKWEKSAWESSLICNRAAGFNRCLLKVQQNIQSQIKAIKS